MFCEDLGMIVRLVINDFFVEVLLICDETICVVSVLCVNLESLGSGE